MTKTTGQTTKQWDLSTPKLNIDNKFTTLSPNTNNIETYNQNMQIIRNDKKPIHCYTDGSKDENGKTGSGLTFEMENDKIEDKTKLPEFCTVFQAELIAITRAAEIMNEKRITDKIIYIWSDSKSSIDALASIKTKTRTVSIAIQTLNKLATNNKVTIAWIKAHIGIPGNERADELAKAATIDGNIRSCPPPFSRAVKELKEWTTRETTKEFENSGGKHTKRLLADTQNSYETRTEQHMITDTQTYNRITKQTKDLMKTRQSIRTATHIITQHGENNHHLGKIGKTQNGLCTLCQHEEETVEHIICKCPAIAQKREELSGSAYLSDIYSTLRNNPLKEAIDIMLLFLKRKKLTINDTED